MTNGAVQKGVFITFEGADGSGKTTQAALLADALRQKGRGVIQVREPGGTPVSEQIREIILNGENAAMTNITELLLYAAARAQIIAEVINPALMSGQTVICDRFSDSTIAYQHYGRGVPLDTVRYAVELACGGAGTAGDALIPTATFFLDIPPKTAFERGGAKPNDRLEAAGLSFQEKVYAGYKQIAKTRQNFYTINATGTPAEIHAQILNILTTRGIL